MQQWSRILREDLKEFVHHGFCLREVGTVADRIGEDLRIEQVENWRQVYFLIANGELGDICYQLLERFVRNKIPVQDVVRYFAYSSLVGTILVFPLFSLKIHIPHQTLSCFVIDTVSGFPQFHVYTPIAVSPLILDKYRFDLNSDLCILIRSV